MSSENLSFGKCVSAADLTPSQIAALPFVPGNITSFDEKNPLPPSGRGHWSFIKENPGDFIEKFSLELGFLGVRIGVFFLVNEKFHDPATQTSSDITVNLITQPETFPEIENHLKSNNIAHQALETGSGFALPYLGSIQKVLDSLKLEPVINYLFIKNLISRENYFCWLSVPETMLTNTRPNILAKIKQSDQAMKRTPAPFEPGLRKSYNKATSPQTTSPSIPLDVPPPTLTEPPQTPVDKPAIPSPTDALKRPLAAKPQPKAKPAPQAPTPAPTKPNDDILSMLDGATEETKPPFPTKEKKDKKPEKETPPVQENSREEDTQPAPGKTTKVDASLFLCLGLFNFFSTQLLIGFIAGQMQLVQDMFLETNTMAALASILLTFLVIRPNFRNKSSRAFTFLIFLLYLIAVGFQIFTHQQYTPGNYFFTPSLVAMISLLAAIILGFVRIDKIHSSKSKSVKAPKPAAKKKEAKPPAAKKAKPPVSPKIKKKAQQERTKKALANPKADPNPEQNPIKDMLNLEKPKAEKESAGLSVPQGTRETNETAPKRINFAPKKTTSKPFVEPRGEATDRLKELEAVENAKDPLSQLEALVNTAKAPTPDLIPEATPKKWMKNKTQSSSKELSAPRSSITPEKANPAEPAATGENEEDQLLNSLKLSLPKRNKKKTD